MAKKEAVAWTSVVMTLSTEVEEEECRFGAALVFQRDDDGRFHAKIAQSRPALEDWALDISVARCEMWGFAAYCVRGCWLDSDSEERKP